MNAHVVAWAFVRVYLVYRVSPEPRNANRATKFRAFSFVYKPNTSGLSRIPKWRIKRVGEKIIKIKNEKGNLFTYVAVVCGVRLMQR